MPNTSANAINISAVPDGGQSSIDQLGFHGCVKTIVLRVSRYRQDGNRAFALTRSLGTLNRSDYLLTIPRLIINNQLGVRHGIGGPSVFPFKEYGKFTVGYDFLLSRPVFEPVNLHLLPFGITETARLDNCVGMPVLVCVLLLSRRDLVWELAAPTAASNEDSTTVTLLDISVAALARPRNGDGEVRAGGFLTRHGGGLAVGFNIDIPDDVII